MRYRAKPVTMIWSMCIVALVLMLTCRGEPVSAIQPQPYRPSGIPVAELGDWLPRGRLNVTLLPQNPDRIGVHIQRILQETARSAEERGLDGEQTEQVPDLTPEILGLARGLENDPLAMYEFVYNHIDFIPTWGLLKNPRETLLAGAGNAFDQAALLSALLRAAGFETRYVWGTIQVPKSEAMNWVGVTDPSVVASLFASGGIPADDDGNSLRLNHVWVKVQVESAWYSLDPSFKEYEVQTGQDLGAMTGYDLAAFVSVAEQGSTITEDFVQNINTTGIEGLLKQYSMSFLGDLRAGDTFAYLSDVAGGRRIAPIQSTTYPEQLPYTVVDVLGEAQDIPDDFAYILHIQLPGIDYSVNWDDIAGERVTVFYEGATQSDRDLIDQAGGIYNVEPAYVVNMVPILRVGGQTVVTGSPLTLGTQESITVTVSTPFLDEDGERFWSPAFTQSLIAGEWYAIPMRLQFVSQKALARQIQILEENSGLGLADDAEPVLGQALHVLGMSYFNEVDVGDRLDAQLAGVVPILHFSVMLASRNLIVWVDRETRLPVRLDPASHTVDVQMNVGGVISTTGDNNRERAFTLSSGIRGSATEHAIIEQLQPVPGISTIQVIYLANTRDGQKIYTVTPSNANRVISILSENHGDSVIDSVINDVNKGWYVVIPEAPVGYKQWLGSGWISLDPASGSSAYLISGGLGGGSGVEWQPPEHSGEIMDRSRHNITVFAFHGGSLISDPVDVTTGSFVYRNTDMASLEGRGIPLRFQRTYNSSRHSSDGPAGFGWTHSYNVRFYTASDWIRAFGGRMALEASPALVSALAELDLFEAVSIPHQRYTIVSEVAQWLMAQITDNAAILAEEQGSLSTHLRLPDGSYQPPAGSGPITLSQNAGDMTTVTREGGAQLEFDSQGRLMRLWDANGNQTTMSYDASGRLVQVTDAVGRSLNLSYDGERLTQVTDPAGRALRYAYDTAGNLIRYTNARGGTTTYTYDTRHHLVSITDPEGATYVTNEYDELGRVVVQQDGRGGETRFLYAGDRTTVLDPMAYRVVYHYNGRRRLLLGIENALGCRTTREYDAGDHLIRATNGLGLTTSFAYDAWGHTTVITDALGYATVRSYDGAGNLIRYIDALGNTWSFSYDDHHNLTTSTDPLGNVTQYQYDGQGQLTVVRDASDRTMTFTYDEHGNLRCMTGLRGQTCWEYDGVGRPTAVIDGVGQRAQRAYDAADNLIQATDPLGNAVIYSYDGNSTLTGVTDGAGQHTQFQYDAQFNLIAVTDALEQATHYRYDANNGLVSITDANGHETMYQRDPVGRLTEATDPLGRTVHFAYNCADRLISFQGADEQTITYIFDDVGRLVEIDYPEDPDAVFMYDPAGHLSRAVSDSQWEARYQYDAAGRLIQVRDLTRDLTTAYTYDPAGRRLRTTVASGANQLYDVEQSYDSAGRLEQLADRMLGGSATTQYDYDAAGRLIQITLPTSARTTYSYGPAGRINTIRHLDAAGDPFTELAYSFDAAGNPATLQETTPTDIFTTTYSYDALNRLVQEAYPRYNVAYTYDAVGNRVQRVDPRGAVTYVYDADDQLISRGNERFEYDARGNLVAWHDRGDTYELDYDAENRLTRLTLPDEASFVFKYDAFGRLIAREGPDGVRSFLYDGLQAILAGETEFGQTDVRRYLYGNDLLAGRYAQPWGFSAYHGDAQGSVRHLSDDSGYPQDAYRYDAFGYPLGAAGIDRNLYRFLGQQGGYLLDGTGRALHLLGFRYYAPALGRFLTRDPLPGETSLVQSLNDYSYALNNPVRYTDASGLRPPVLSITRLPGPESPSEDAIAAGRALPQEVTMPSPSQDMERRTQDKMRGRPPASTLRLIEELRGESIIGPRSRYAALSIGSVGDIRQPAVEQLWFGVGERSSVQALVCAPAGEMLVGAFYRGLFRSSSASSATWVNTHSSSVVAIAQADARTWYAATWGEGVLKSIDGGTTWSISVDGLVVNDVYALAVDPAAPNMIYAGTESGLFKSTDAAAHWEQAGETLPGQVVHALTFASETLLAATDKGMFRSSDGGATWLSPEMDIPVGRINTLHVAGTTAYAGTSRGVFRSVDQGRTWTSLSDGLTVPDIHALTSDPDDRQHLWAGTAAGVFASQDGGAYWDLVTTNGLAGYALHIRAIEVCDVDGEPTLYVGTGRGVYALKSGPFSRVRLPVVLKNASGEAGPPQVTPTPTPTPTTTPTPTGTPTPTPTPTVTPTPTLAPLFADDFSDPSSGWQQGTSDNGSARYVDGEYEVTMRAQWTALWGYRPQTFDDFDVRVGARALGSNVNGAAALVFRRQDSNNLYFFTVSPSDREYTLSKFVNGADTDLVGPTFSSHIRSGGQTNQLRIVAQGDRISLYVNDQHLTDVTDTSMGAGYFALGAWNFDNPAGTTIRFDNFVVYAVP